jgi:hypothetical protein
MIKVEPLITQMQNERGTNYSYMHDRNGTQLLIFRNAGSISGRHYHKGFSSTKNPEILMLLSGKCTLNCFHIETHEKISIDIDFPAKIYISALVWHEVIALTDICMIEMNSIEEHISDTFYLNSPST